MRRAVLALTLMGLSATAVAAAEGLFDDPKALETAQAQIDEANRKGVRVDEATHELVIDSSKEAPAVPLPITLDVQWGSGHGGSLHFVRFEIGDPGTTIEHLSYRAYVRDDSIPWRARRAEVPTTDLVELVSLVRAEARTEVEVRRKPDSTRLGGRSFSSSGDFFVLARLTRDGVASTEREFCGYAGSRGQPRYTGLRHVVRAARDYLEAVGTWTTVPPESYRETHFDAAFAANSDLMLRQFHWWVMERSVEMSAVFGSSAAVPTLEHLDRKYPTPQPRQRAKIRNALGRSDHYLDGEPKTIPETLDPEIAVERGMGDDVNEPVQDDE